MAMAPRENPIALEIKKKKKAPNKPRGCALGTHFMWLSLCFEETFLITSRGNESRRFRDREGGPLEPLSEPRAAAPTSGHREVPQPPGLPEPHHLLPTPSFPEAALAPDAPGNRAKGGCWGESATGRPSRGLTVPSGCQPETGAPCWSLPRPVSPPHTQGSGRSLHSVTRIRSPQNRNPRLV